MPGLIATKTRPSQRKLQAQQQLQQIQLQPPQRGRAASPSMQHIEQQQQQQQQNASTRAPAGLRLSSAAASSMPNALVSLVVLVVLCAAAYMHFFQLSVSTVNIQSIIDQRVKEAGAAVGGPQYVTRLDLVSASASNMKRENQR